MKINKRDVWTHYGVVSLTSIVCLIVINMMGVLQVEAGDFFESKNVTLSDLGMRKLEVLDDRENQDDGWIVTWKITRGADIIVHRSYAIFRPEYASRASLLMIDPRMLGGDYDGIVVKCHDVVKKLPKFSIQGETIRSDGPTKKAILISDGQDVNIYYMVETVKKEKLLSIYQSESDLNTLPVGKIAEFALKTPSDILIFKNE